LLFLIGLALLLSLLPAAGLGSTLRALAAGPQVEYVNNGGFETGDFSGWRVSRAGFYPAVQGDRVNLGDHAIHMGKTAGDTIDVEDMILSVSVIAQEVVIAGGTGGPLILKFDYLKEGEDTGFWNNFLAVFINGEIIFSTEWEDDKEGWQTYEFDLNELEQELGDSFTLAVVCGTNDPDDTADYYIDNITLVANGVEMIENGSFETGDFSGWRVSHCGPFPVVQGEKSSQGQYAAHMGDGGEELFNPLRIASIAQEITLPAWAENPLLKLAYLVEFGEELEGYEFEGNEWFWLEVLIDDRQVLYACSHTDGWQDYEYDLSEYIGETFTLSVSSVLDREKFWLPEGIEIFSIDFYVDDISITATGVEPEEPLVPEEPSEPVEPQEPEEDLPQTGGTPFLAGLPALVLISGGAALLRLWRRLFR
jgi:hypothetical protein